MQDSPVVETVVERVAEAPIVPIEQVIPQSIVEVINPKGRHFLAVFFFSFLWGTFGVDRFYLGKIGTGILKLVTIGGLGLWTLIDLILIMSGAMKDKQGNEMLEFQRYKKLAARTVLWFAILTGLYILIGGITTILSIQQIIEHYQSGGGSSSLNSLKSVLPAGALQSLGIGN
jgi:TM2 domain-containing membrane protein YozV